MSDDFSDFFFDMNGNGKVDFEDYVLQDTLDDIGGSHGKRSRASYSYGRKKTKFEMNIQNSYKKAVNSAREVLEYGKCNSNNSAERIVSEILSSIAFLSLVNAEAKEPLVQSEIASKKAEAFNRCVNLFAFDKKFLLDKQTFSENSNEIQDKFLRLAKCDMELLLVNCPGNVDLCKKFISDLSDATDSIMLGRSFIAKNTQDLLLELLDDCFDRLDKTYPEKDIRSFQTKVMYEVYCSKSSDCVFLTFFGGMIGLALGVVFFYVVFSTNGLAGLFADGALEGIIGTIVFAIAPICVILCIIAALTSSYQELSKFKKAYRRCVKNKTS